MPSRPRWLRPRSFRRRRAAVVLTLLVLAGGSAALAAGNFAGQPDTVVDQGAAQTGGGSADSTPGVPRDTDVSEEPPAQGFEIPPSTPSPSGPHLRVPVLLYHYIRDNPAHPGQRGWDLSVAPAQFARQMAYLRAAGAHTVTPADVLLALGGARPLPPRAVVLTFDDGYADFATTAVPVLVQQGLVATDYVVSGFIGRPNYMTAEQVRWVASQGMVIGAHTVHHVALKGMPTVMARTEIEGSRQALGALLGEPVVDFAYPYGSFDQAAVRLVAAAGFRDAVTTLPGSEQYQALRYELRRIRIGAGDTLSTFARKAQLPPPSPEAAVPPPAAGQPLEHSAASEPRSTGTPAVVRQPPVAASPTPSALASPAAGRLLPL